MAGMARSGARRLIRHGLAGVGAATFAVFAGVTAIGKLVAGRMAGLVESVPLNPEPPAALDIAHSRRSSSGSVHTPRDGCVVI